MGGVSRRGFLKAVSGLLAAAAVPTGAASLSGSWVDATLGAAEWKYQLVDFHNRLGVTVRIVRPDGVEMRYAVRVEIPSHSGRVKDELDAFRKYPEIVMEARQALRDWVVSKEPEYLPRTVLA